MKKGPMILITIVLAITLGVISTFIIMENDRNKDKNYNHNDTNNNTDNPVQLPNPMDEYDDLDELKEDISFEFLVPDIIYNDYKQSEYYIINDDLVEIVYSNNVDEIIYRAKKSDGAFWDISGINEIFNEMENITIDNQVLIAKGNDGTISVALFMRDDILYSISFDEAVDSDTLKNIIKDIIK